VKTVEGQFAVRQLMPAGLELAEGVEDQVFKRNGCGRGIEES
jgi:hypothetical protein